MTKRNHSHAFGNHTTPHFRGNQTTPIRTNHGHGGGGGGGSTTLFKKVKKAIEKGKKVMKEFTHTGTGTGSKTKSHESVTGYKGMSQLFTSFSKHPSHKFKLSKQLTLPSIYRDTSPYQNVSAQNQQNFKITRGFLLGADIQVLYQDANQITGTAANLTVPAIDGFSEVRNLLLDKVHIETTFLNCLESTCELDIYWVVAKTNAPIATPLDPSVDYSASMAEQQQSGIANNIYPWSTPMETYQFKKDWKIISHHRVLLEEGSYHREHFTFNVNKLFNMSNAYIFSTQRGITHYMLYSVKGLPLPSNRTLVSSDPAVAIGPAKVALIENVAYTTRFPLGTAAQSSWQHSNIGTATNLYTKNEGSGVVEDVLGAISAVGAGVSVQ